MNVQPPCRIIAQQLQRHCGIPFSTIFAQQPHAYLRTAVQRVKIGKVYHADAAAVVQHYYKARLTLLEYILLALLKIGPQCITGIWQKSVADTP